MPIGKFQMPMETFAGNMTHIHAKIQRITSDNAPLIGINWSRLASWQVKVKNSNPLRTKPLLDGALWLNFQVQTRGLPEG
jgi:hypothetical protein